MSISSFRKLGEQKPRAVEVIRRNAKGEAPRGLKRVSKNKAVEQWDPIIPEIAAGRMPLDEKTAEIYASVLEKRFRDVQRG